MKNRLIFLIKHVLINENVNINGPQNFNYLLSQMVKWKKVKEEGNNSRVHSMRWSSLTPMTKVMLQKRMLGDTTDGREKLVKHSEKVGRASQRKDAKEMREKAGRDAGCGKDKQQQRGENQSQRCHTSFCSISQCTALISEIKMICHSG